MVPDTPKLIRTQSPRWTFTRSGIMRLLMWASVILLGLCLGGCTGELPATKMAPAKAIYSIAATLSSQAGACGRSAGIEVAL